jgi:hypothetical protein
VSMFKDQESLSMFEDFAKYLEMPVTGKPKGSIKPKENS